MSNSFGFGGTNASLVFSTYNFSKIYILLYIRLEINKSVNLMKFLLIIGLILIER